LEDLEAGKVEYESAGDFLAEIKKEFGGGDEESLKVAELKRIEQRGRMMEEFVQDFKRVARGCYGMLWTLTIFLFFYLISLILY